MRDKVVLVTGGARRVGAAIVRELHQQGARVIIHYHHSTQDAERLVAELNRQRPDSIAALQADLLDIDSLPELVAKAAAVWDGLDGLVNNASSFFATPLSALNESAWQDLMGTNLKAPLFLAKAASYWLVKRRGAIVNITDIHAEQPMPQYILYSIAKAGLVAMTRSLALELAPDVRVNAVAPGANLWPETAVFSAEAKARIVSSIPLARAGTPEDVAKMVHFLLSEAQYVTGQIIRVDGGRGLALC